MLKRIVITGATGFIGKILSRQLIETGYDVVALSRNPDKAGESLGEKVSVVKWDAKTSFGWIDYADGAYGIVNLTGENIGAGRWNQTKKQRILQSRLDSGKAVLEAVEKAKNKPNVVIQASGIGYYGDRGDEILDESSSSGSGFLVAIAKKWEKTTKQVESMGIRHIVIRTGVVLGKDEGFLPRVLLPFRLFAGGHLGSGKQWISWIHIEGEAKAIRFLIEREDSKDVFNLTSPNSLTSKDFFNILGKVMRRPSWLHIPGFALRLFLGEMAEELILSGQRAVPKRLLESGYEFLYPNLEPVLNEIQQ